MCGTSIDADPSKSAIVRRNFYDLKVAASA